MYARNANRQFDCLEDGASSRSASTADSPLTPDEHRLTAVVTNLSHCLRTAVSIPSVDDGVGPFPLERGRDPPVRSLSSIPFQYDRTRGNPSIRSNP
ncbi:MULTISPECIES: hypothetical protein [Natrialbaceae]|uniref:hypothetical protein n=1 Tax=Natrialbaceae TaxID=1644061 RepID=UPI00207C6FF1|nr:hypothetical protein [Natronococcus sp. CG52]